MDVSPASLPALHSSGSSFPIIIIAITGILGTALLLVSYYIFVIKCCLSWHRIDLLLPINDPPTVDSARGLDGSVIRSIPIFRFKKGGDKECECSVCLNEFEEEEKLRMIPNCSHVFHIDCIDVWLQSNPNCPLCRATICIAPLCPSMGDEDTNVEQIHVKKRGMSMGDECIDMRSNTKDDEFRIQPIRRSMSMDSWTDRPMYLAVPEEIGRRHGCDEEGIGSRVRRSLFSFGHGSCRGSRSSAVLPV